MGIIGARAVWYKATCTFRLAGMQKGHHSIPIFNLVKQIDGLGIPAVDEVGSRSTSPGAARMNSVTVDSSFAQGGRAAWSQVS